MTDIFDKIANRLRDELGEVQTIMGRRLEMDMIVEQCSTSIRDKLVAAMEAVDQQQAAIGHGRELFIDEDALIERLADTGTVAANLGKMARVSPEILAAVVKRVDTPVLRAALEISGPYHRQRLREALNGLDAD